MSKPEKQTVTYPKCRETIASMLWHSINTDMPDAVLDIISGKLFEVECKKAAIVVSQTLPPIPLKEYIWIISIMVKGLSFQTDIQFPRLNYALTARKI